jgi:hypothetical protein
MHRACFPNLLRDRNGRQLQVRPAVCLLAVLMELVVVLATERHRELIADLSAQGPRLRDLEVVGIAGAHLANQAGLRGDKGEVGFATLAGRLREWSDQLTC